MDWFSLFMGLLMGSAGVYLLFIKHFSDTKTALEKDNIKLKTQLQEKQAAHDKELTLLKDAKVEFAQAFNEVLKAEQGALSEKNSELLKPLAGELQQFKARIEHITQEQIKERSVLFEQIKSLRQANIETQQTAQNLTNALTYDNKQQGNWGEVVLSTILSSCGLREGYEYDVQKQFSGDEGDIFKPDVVIHLPRDKDIVIDAKVSLKDYKDYIADMSNEQALKNHIQSIRRHIDHISVKNYENLRGVKTLDFIFVFVPIESALWVALENQNDLFDDALKKKIMLVSPSTLTMSLKTIDHIWNTEKQNKNTQEIVRQAAAMYDKFVGFVKSLDQINEHLNRAQKSYTDAKNKLADGRGNLIRSADKLKELGVRTKKELS